MYEIALALIIAYLAGAASMLLLLAHLGRRLRQIGPNQKIQFHEHIATATFPQENDE